MITRTALKCLSCRRQTGFFSGHPDKSCYMYVFINSVRFSLQVSIQLRFKRDKQTNLVKQNFRITICALEVYGFWEYFTVDCTRS